MRFSRSNPTAAVTIAYLSSARLHEVCFADDVDVDEAQLQTCFGSSQDIFGATETGATFSSTRRWIGVRPATRPRADEVRVLPTGSQPLSPMSG